MEAAARLKALEAELAEAQAKGKERNVYVGGFGGGHLHASSYDEVERHERRRSELAAEVKAARAAAKAERKELRAQASASASASAWTSKLLEGDARFDAAEDVRDRRAARGVDHPPSSVIIAYVAYVVCVVSFVSIVSARSRRLGVMIPFRSSRFGSIVRSIVRRFFLFLDTFPVNARSRIRRRMDGCVSRSRRAKTDGDDARRDARWISLFLFLSSSLSSSRRRRVVVVVALSRAPSTPRHAPIPSHDRPVDRERSVARDRGRRRGVSLESPLVDRPIDRSDGRTIGARRAARGTARRGRRGRSSERPVCRSDV